jgi:hypothetical protein
MRKRPEVQKRVDELQASMAKSNEEELHNFLEDSGLTPAYLLKQMLESANEAKDAKKFDIAIKGYTELGKELFGMFVDRKNVTVEKNVNNNSSTTIAIQDFSTAFQRLAQSFGGPEIEGTATHVEQVREIGAPEFSASLLDNGHQRADSLFVLDDR